MTRRTSRWVVAASVSAVLVAAIGASTYLEHRDVVEATSRVVLTPARAPERPSQQFNPAPTLLLTRSIESYSSLVTSENFIRRVIDVHQLDTTPTRLREAISVTSPPDTTVMEFTVRGRDSADVMATASAIGQEFTEALADLESPTPIGSIVLGPVEPESAFPRTALRTAVLATSATIISFLVAMLLLDQLNPASTGNRAADRKRQQAVSTKTTGGSE